MKKILVVNNNIDPPYEGATEIVDRIREHVTGFGAVDIVMLRAPSGELPKSAEGFDGIFLSGSKTRIAEEAPWISAQEEFIRDVERRQIPMLGICYGHQLIAKAIAGPTYTQAAQKPEHGWAKIELLAEASRAPIFAALPKAFHTFQFHNDEVLPTLPADKFITVAKSAACAVQAFALKKAPIWGVQFHPERPLLAGNASLDRLAKREPQKEILNRENAEKLFSPNIAKEIFQSFLRVILQGKK